MEYQVLDGGAMEVTYTAVTGYRQRRISDESAERKYIFHNFLWCI